MHVVAVKIKIKCAFEYTIDLIPTRISENFHAIMLSHTTLPALGNALVTGHW